MLFIVQIKLNASQNARYLSQWLCNTDRLLEQHCKGAVRRELSLLLEDLNVKPFSSYIRQQTVIPTFWIQVFRLSPQTSITKIDLIGSSIQNLEKPCPACVAIHVTH